MLSNYGKARKKTQKWFSWLELHVGNLLCHSSGLLNNSQGEVFSWESSYLDQKGNLHLGTSKPSDSYQAFPTARRDISFTDSFLFDNFLCPPEFLKNDKQNGFTEEQLKQTQFQSSEQQFTDEVTQQWSVAVHWYRHQTPTHRPWENKKRMARSKNQKQGWKERTDKQEIKYKNS